MKFDENAIIAACKEFKLFLLIFVTSRRTILHLELENVRTYIRYYRDFTDYI